MGLIRKIFKKKEPEKNTLKTADINKRLIEEAFEINGVKYYKFKSEYDIPIMRFSWFEKFLSDFQTRTERNLYLNTLNNIKKELNTDGGINLMKLGQLVQILDDRAKYYSAPDIAYLMASVVFFDENENLAEWDQDYNEAKIEIWKEEKAAFFLTASMKSLFPSLAALGDDLPTYLSQYAKMTAAHTELVQNIRK